MIVDLWGNYTLKREISNCLNIGTFSWQESKTTDFDINHWVFLSVYVFFLFFSWLVTIKGGLLSSTFYNRKCTNISVPLGKKTCCKLSNHGCSESFHKFITQTLYEGFLAFLGCVVVLVLAIFIISSLTLNS